MKYNSSELREKYLEFFASKGHIIVPSASVVPENDPTVLFNTAGMQPLVPYLLGEKHPSGERIANSQKCIRTGDIEDVGDNTHLTFFEMLGNWSLGDYFKKESIAWSYELLTSPKWFNIDPKKIAVTVFEGDEDAPRDEESAAIWAEQGMPLDRISYLPKSENWWAAGPTGPCGPDTEIFYWVGASEFPPVGSNVGNDEKNWMEIWNNVFMEFNKLADGTLEKLPNKNVDTGMGLERITATLNGVKTVYDTDIFNSIIHSISKNIGVDYNETTMKSIRVIADHTRAATVMISDGVLPSNVDQGYVLRRLIRRAIRQAYKLGYKGEFLHNVAIQVVEKLGHVYPHMIEKEEEIVNEVLREERQFGETLEKGLKEFDKLISGFQIAFERTGNKVDTISGDKAFKLYDTYGFPLEMTIELAQEKGLKVDIEGFNNANLKHQELSRAGAQQKFKGGLADSGEETTALHSATHLLLAGLRKFVGTHVHQKGSNITAERLRFDFNNDDKIEKDILDKVEAYVNEAIASGLQVTVTNVPKEEAKASGVEGSFWEKYPDIVKVYSMVGANGTVYSKELCGGPHIENSQNMGRFIIQKEESSSRGVRRIKAILIK
ncbi:MAG: alanine--tRNA ligase [Candidatus Gracilibacteria bacterium]|nr:alanine--tRNA ligase [Candidatus Gracilibacteria bacterium]